MANKSIVFTLSNGEGTITVSEDSILYMFQEVGGDYLLSVDEGKDREVHYIVDEDIATLEAAATKMFSVTLSAEDQALSINADRINTLVNLTGDKLDLSITGSATSGSFAGGLVDLSRALPASHFTTLGVKVGDTINNTTNGLSGSITSVGTNNLQFTPTTVGFAVSDNYSITRGGSSPTRIFYRGVGADLDIKEVSDSLSDVTTLINAL